MKDSELLERAATAAGYKWQWFGEDFCTERDERTGLHKPWNPLEDDGDALRLAVKLHIDVCWNENDGPWEVNAWPPNGGMGANEGPEDHGGDPSAAARRAIVCAAATDERSAEPTRAGTERHTRNEPDPESGIRISPGSSIPVERGMV